MLVIKRRPGQSIRVGDAVVSVEEVRRPDHDAWYAIIEVTWAGGRRRHTLRNMQGEDLPIPGAEVYARFDRADSRDVVRVGILAPRSVNVTANT